MAGNAQTFKPSRHPVLAQQLKDLLGHRSQTWSDEWPHLCHGWAASIGSSLRYSKTVLGWLQSLLQKLGTELGDDGAVSAITPYRYSSSTL